MKKLLLLGVLATGIVEAAGNANDIKQPTVGWYAPSTLHMSDDWLAKVDPYTLTHYFLEDRHVEISCSFDPFRQGGWPQADDREKRQLPELRKLADKYGFKIMLMLGGWGGSFHFSDCCAEENRAKFVDELVNHLVTYDYDGVDLDYEHIGIAGAADFENLFDPNMPDDAVRAWHTKKQRDQLLSQGWKLHRPTDWPDFQDTIDLLREKLNEAGAKTGKVYELGSAMSIGGQAEACRGLVEGAPEPVAYGEQQDDTYFRYVPCSRPDWPRLCEQLDFLNIMVYDVWGPHYPSSGHHAPFNCDPAEPMMQRLSPPFNESCQPRRTVVNAVEWFLDPFEPGTSEADKPGGCPAHKMNMGYPTYAKSHCGSDGLYTNSTGCNSENLSPDFLQAASPSYRGIRTMGQYQAYKEYFKNATTTGQNGEEKLVASYYYNPEERYFMTYDSAEMIYEKTKYISEQGLQGYFFYHAGDDYNYELDHAAYSGWYAGKNAPQPEFRNLVCSPSDGVSVAVRAAGLAAAFSSLLLIA